MTSAQNAVIALIADLYDVLDPVPPRLVENVITSINRYPTKSNYAASRDVAGSGRVGDWRGDA